MKAVMLKPEHKLALVDVPKPSLDGPGQILVKVTGAAICGSDVHIKYGDIPIAPETVIGHEFVGVVAEAAPDVQYFKPGDRVNTAACLWCGCCPACRRGEVQYCQVGGIWGGGFFKGRPLPGAQTEYVQVFNADMCAVPIPDNVPDEQAILVGDVLGTGYHSVVEGGVGPGDTVAVFGCGPVGLAALASLQLFGPARVFAIDVLPNRLALAEKFGAEIIDASKTDAVSEILGRTDMNGVDVAIEAAGLPVCFTQALNILRRGGSLSVVGLFPESVQLNLPILGLSGVRLSMGLGNLGSMRTLMNLLENGRLDLSSLITHHFPLSEAMEAYDLFENHKNECIKVMLRP
ncbi:MAG: alcohol dehydrogenase catalytic domain-containing protein [Deltaproteobacteria bacterium]|nr:alcohol dehydrogenase catalytic domain-containing protein [Deltaproteobacteria bacterium]